MEGRGRSRTPSRLGSGSQLGEQLFAQKIEQKLQRQNALLEARLHRLAVGDIPQPQSAHSSNPAGNQSESSSVNGRGKNSKNRPENSNRPRSADLGGRNGSLSSQQRTPQSRKGVQKERVSEYAGQIRSGGSVAGMFDPKYASRESIDPARKQENGQSIKYQDKRVNESGSRERQKSDYLDVLDKVSRQKKTSGPEERERVPSRGREVSKSGSRERLESRQKEQSDRREEHPSWLFADASSSKRGSESGDSARHSNGRGDFSNKGRREERASSTRISNGQDSARRTSEARKGKGIRTLSGQGSLEDRQVAAAYGAEPRSSRGEDIEVLQERIASGSAVPSGRPNGGSWPSEVAQNPSSGRPPNDSYLPEDFAQRETELYEQLYRPSTSSLSFRKKMQGATGFDTWKVETQTTLGRTSSKLEQLLMQVERDGLQASSNVDPQTARVQRDDASESETAQSVKRGLHIPENLDSPQGGFRGERRSQPYEHEPNPRAPVESTGPLSAFSVGSGLTGLLNGGFLSEGLEARERRAVDADTRGSTATTRPDSLEGALASVMDRGRELSKSKVSREGSESGAASTSRPSSARSAADFTRERAQKGREGHVSTSERPASASNTSRRAQGSGRTKSSDVAASVTHRASTDGQDKLERSNSGRRLSRSASKSGVFRIASPLQRETSTDEKAGPPSKKVESSEDFEATYSVQEQAKMVARPDRLPAFVPNKELQRARSISPGAERRMEDRFEAEAKERTRRLQRRVQEQAEEREVRELAECTFAPTISSKSKELFDSGNRVDFLDRIRSWKSRRDARILEEKEKRERRELRECTFQPTVTRYESPLRERQVPSESGARGSFWRSEWDGLPARAPNWEGSLRDGGTHYALEQQKHGSLQTTRDRSTSAPPLRPWSALARAEPQNLGVRFDYGLSRLGFAPESRPASALSTARGLGFGAEPRVSVGEGDTVSSELRTKPVGLEAHDVSDVYSVASQRAQTEWEARHYERMMSARRHSMDLRRLLNQFNGSSWRYSLTRPQEPNLSDKAHVRVRALEQPISPSSYAYN